MSASSVDSRAKRMRRHPEALCQITTQALQPPLRRQPVAFLQRLKARTCGG
eukprot:CAMPEP_0198544860 /NCGR_PEP_ID=MMETSP1462-20131121/62167_1 /TAXON_ID=1333877 /ORGANISM="Brandtodinium nutriculum, Strain RCC3387" /LENGTH=50 /DNA_ID=CAMNT_0044275217 /DNA_START=61 /DNA_END=210 /DNA_ORIENTATION=-